MLKMVDGTGIIGVDMICPLGVSTPQPPNYDRVELEGSGMLVLPNSLDAPLERLELGGKTEQVQTTGKNLLDEKLLKTLSNYTSNGLDYYYHRISGLEVGKKYTVSRGDVKTGKGALLGISVNQESTNKAKFLVYDGLGTVYNNASITWEQTTGEYVDILFSVSGSVTSTTQERLSEFWGRISYVQLEKGTTATPYEPYTGGKPSPSPEYPQEIKNSGKWNEETQKYEIEISISGRNLFDFSTCEEGKIFEGSGNIISATNGVLTDFIPCFPNSQYSRSRTESTVVAFYDCDKNKIGFEIVGNTTFVTPEKCRYFRFSALKTQVDYTKIVACPGQTVMDYEPYREPKFSIITSDRPITKWDRLVEQGGQIGWLYKSKTATITGKEHYSAPSESYYSGTSTNMYTVDFGLFIKGGEYCNRLQRIDGIWDSSNTNNIGFTTNASDQIHIRIYNSLLNVSDNATKEEKVAAFKTYLTKEYENGNPYIVIFQTKDTEFIPLPQSEQNAIRALKTYYPTTVITVDGGELDPDIKVTYRKEI